MKKWLLLALLLATSPALAQKIVLLCTKNATDYSCVPASATNPLPITPAVPTVTIDMMTGTLDSRVTFTRASTAWCFDNTGTLQSISSNVPCFEYDPRQLALKGMRIEGARTNLIRNDTMVGAGAGTPGTTPTNWGSFTGGTITRQIVGTGTEQGVDYIEIRYSGTSNANTGLNLVFEGNQQIAALTGQSWSGSFYLRLLAGDFSNITNVRLVMSERDSGGSLVLDNYSPELKDTIALDWLAPQRFKYGVVLSGGAGTAFLAPRLDIAYVNGAIIDFTIRLGLPQAENAINVSSPIKTSTVAVTRASDVAIVTDTSWFNSVNGTFECEVLPDFPASVPSALGFPTPCAMNDGDSTDEMQFYVNGTNANRSAKSTSNSVTQFDVQGSIFTADTVLKHAMRYRLNDFAWSYNGASVATSTTAALPVGVNRLQIGHNSSGSNFLFGYFRKYNYWNRGLANAELQLVTQ